MGRAWILVLLLAGCLQSADNPRFDEAVYEAAPWEGPLVDWPTLNGANQGWRVAPDVPYCDGHWKDCYRPEWKVRPINQGDHGAAKSSPVLYDGVLYIGDDTGTLYAFWPNGTLLWSNTTEPSRNGIHGTPAVDDERVYIGAYDGALYAFDRSTGARLWKAQLGDWIGASPRLHEGEVYIAVEYAGSTRLGEEARSAAWGRVHILDAATGQETWRSQPLGSHPHSTVAIADGAFVVGCNDDHVYAWDLASRELRWSFHADGGGEGDVKGPIALFDGAAFFGSWDHRYYRVDLETGQADWVFQADGWIMTGTAVDPVENTVFFGSHDRHVYALDAATGAKKWSQKIGRHVIGSPTLAGQVLLFGASDHHLHAFDKDTGEVLWSYPTLHRVSTAPVVVGDRIVFADRSEAAWGGTHGILYALAPVG